MSNLITFYGPFLKKKSYIEIKMSPKFVFIICNIRQKGSCLNLTGHFDSVLTSHDSKLWLLLLHFAVLPCVFVIIFFYLFIWRTQTWDHEDGNWRRV